MGHFTIGQKGNFETIKRVAQVFVLWNATKVVLSASHRPTTEDVKKNEIQHTRIDTIFIVLVITTYRITDCSVIFSLKRSYQTNQHRYTKARFHHVKPSTTRAKVPPLSPLPILHPTRVSFNAANKIA